MIELTVKLGAAQSVKVMGDTAQEIISQAAFFSQLPTVCPICGAELRFSYRSPKGFDYYGLRCIGDTPHEKTFGIHRDGKTLFNYESRPFEVARAGQDEDEQYSEPDPAPARPQPRQAAAAAPAQQASRPKPAEGDNRPAIVAQLTALTSIAEKRGIDLDEYCYAQVGVGADNLSFGQASALITQLNKRQ